MSEITLPSQFVLSMLTEISRTRALLDHETDVVEVIVCRGHRSNGVRTKWTATMDRKLLQASHSKGGITRFAERHNMSRQSAYDRLCKLRKAKAAKAKG